MVIKMILYFIRHGMTKGNRERRYVGVTDEPLLAASRALLAQMKLPAVRRVYVSPMFRCRETAELLYPGTETVIAQELRECNFGQYEYKNYEKLKEEPAYRQFLDTMGRSAFPGGEGREAFQERCVRGFEAIMKEEMRLQPVPGGPEDIAFVVHGGTIMALLDHYARPRREYYDWQAANGEGFAAAAGRSGDGGFELHSIRRIDRQGRIT